METLLPIRRRASQHPRRANRSPRGTRPSCKLTARPCAASQKAATTPLTNHKKNHQPRFIRNQQYSITALSDATGTISERYAYIAYGKLTVLDGGGTALSTSAYENRYTYTGREWDGELGLYHYRARMYDAVGGRFVSRDPIGQSDGPNVYQYVSARPANYVDPTGREGTVPVPNWWRPYIPNSHQDRPRIPYEVWREINDCFNDYSDSMDALNESYTDAIQICKDDYQDCICRRIGTGSNENCERDRSDCYNAEWRAYIDDVESTVEDLRDCTSDAFEPLEIHGNLVV